MTDAELDDYFRVIRIEAKTPRTETDPAAIRAIIARVRREGCVNTEDSHFLGVAGVATAIRGPSGRALAGLAVIGRSDASRVGKECVSTCRSRGAPYHKK